MSVILGGRESKMLLFILVAKGSEYVAWREGVLSQVEYVNVLKSDGTLVNISVARYCDGLNV